MIEGQDKERHVLFLHGLFGKAQSFQFLAKAKDIQKNYTCHLLDMRNHGASQRDTLMDYESMARDIKGYMDLAGLTGAKQGVTLVGHSLGAKTAMTFAAMFPDLVHRLVSLDASPVDRRAMPHLNESSERMIEEAIRLGSLEGMGLKNAIKKIKTEVKDEVLQTALLFNLNSDCSFQVNL